MVKPVGCKLWGGCMLFMAALKSLTAADLCTIPNSEAIKLLNQKREKEKKDLNIMILLFFP